MLDASFAGDIPDIGFSNATSCTLAPSDLTPGTLPASDTSRELSVIALLSGFTSDVAFNVAFDLTEFDTVAVDRIIFAAVSFRLIEFGGDRFKVFGEASDSTGLLAVVCGTTSTLLSGSITQGTADPLSIGLALWQAPSSDPVLCD